MQTIALPWPATVGTTQLIHSVVQHIVRPKEALSETTHTFDIGDKQTRGTAEANQHSRRTFRSPLGARLLCAAAAYRPTHQLAGAASITQHSVAATLRVHTCCKYTLQAESSGSVARRATFGKF